MFNVNAYLMLRFTHLFHDSVLIGLLSLILRSAAPRFTCFWAQVFTMFTWWFWFLRLFSFWSWDIGFFFANYAVHLFINRFYGSTSFTGPILLFLSDRIVCVASHPGHFGHRASTSTHWWKQSIAIFFFYRHDNFLWHESASSWFLFPSRALLQDILYIGFAFVIMYWKFDIAGIFEFIIALQAACEQLLTFSYRVFLSVQLGSIFIFLGMSWIKTVIGSSYLLLS